MTCGLPRFAALAAFAAFDFNPRQSAKQCFSLFNVPRVCHALIGNAANTANTANHRKEVSGDRKFAGFGAGFGPSALVIDPSGRISTWLFAGFAGFAGFVSNEQTVHLR